MRFTRNTVLAAGLALGLALSSAPFAIADEATPTTAAEAKVAVDKLQVEATQAEDKAIMATEKSKKSREAMDAKSAEIERTNGNITHLKNYMGKFALTAYKTRGADAPELVIITGDMASMNTRVATTQRVVRNADQALHEYQAEMSKAAELKRAAEQDLKDAETAEAESRKAESEWKDKLARAERIYSNLNATERASFDRQVQVEQNARVRQAEARTATASAAQTPSRLQASSSDTPATPVPSSGRGGAVVAFGMAQLGKPYVLGATGMGAFDCSSLAQAAYRSIGIGIPRTTWSQIGFGAPVSMADAQPGDLVFYNGASHVAIYIGNGQVVQALNPSVGVVISPIGLVGYIDGIRRFG